MISVENLWKAFGKQILFEEASFKINAGERVGLVGRNGHGKTTLFKIIVNEEQPDRGGVTIPRNYRIGYVRQHLAFTEDTVLAEGEKGLPPGERHHTWKVEKILSGLGFSADDMLRHPASFSGGHQVRLNLAKTLLAEPDLLLLDEPTNYLDITSLRWVERYLSSWTHELMLITHDRSFMDAIVTHIVGIHRRKMRKMEGNTEKFYSQIAQDEEIYEKTRLNEDRRHQEIEQFITKFRAKARLANLVESRVKLLQKMGRKEKLEKLKTLDFSFREKPFRGKYAVTVKDLSFSYPGGAPLIRDFSMTVRPQDRVCVVGKNGKGKTTLIKLLAGALVPSGGTITYSPGITKGFFEQTNVVSLVDSRTVVEEIAASYGDVDRQTAWNIAGAMMFDDEYALKPISVLSGGEKSRVMIGKLLATPLNLLLLDEITNHLDMESCDALLAALDNFPGALIMVTHNEMFLHALAERLIVFRDGEVYAFEGSYQHFLEKEGWDDDGADKPARQEVRRQKSPDLLSKKDRRRLRSDLISERSRVLNPLKQRIELIERDIEASEQRLSELNQQMLKASQLNSGAKIVEISQSMHHCRSTIDRLFDELETLTAAYEQHRLQFEEKLGEPALKP
jgi:ATP-binding cassette subfamily F protein 3